MNNKGGEGFSAAAAGAAKPTLKFHFRHITNGKLSFRTRLRMRLSLANRNVKVSKKLKLKNVTSPNLEQNTILTYFVSSGSGIRIILSFLHFIQRTQPSICLLHCFPHC